VPSLAKRISDICWRQAEIGELLHHIASPRFPTYETRKGHGSKTSLASRK
jgi:hypothetical protein